MASSIKANADGTTSVLNGSGQEVLKIPSTAGADVNVATLGDTLGVGQTWQNVTASRAKNTTYTNSTGKPIFIHVFGGGNPTNTNIRLKINGVLMVWSNPSYTANGGIGLSAIIPNGATYIIDEYLGTFTLAAWSELR